MKKIIVGILCLMMLSSFIACSKTTEMIDDTDNALPVTEADNTITVTTEASKVTITNTKEQNFSTESEDGSIIIQITTIDDNFHNMIEEISIIKDGVTLTTINYVIGYYDDVILDHASSIAMINYYGRKWTNFLLLDVTNGNVLFYEPFSFLDIKSIYQNNDMMDYEINDNDVIVFSCDNILNKDTVLISYEVHDMNGYLQSGNFKYTISENKFEDLQENEPYTEG